MERISSIDDPRIAGYQNLKERTLRGENIFVTEGRLLTKRLLESSHECVSLLVSERIAEEFAPLVAPGTPLYSAPEKLLTQVVGFNFHLGVLGLGSRGPKLSLEDMMKNIDTGGQLDIVVCPEVANTENLGSILRSAAAMGVDGVVLGERCCDPFSRRTLRVSMGGVFRLQIVESQDIAEDLLRLRQQWHVELLAAVADNKERHLAEVRRPQRLGLVFGCEADGLDDDCISLCDQRATVPMAPGSDSLNLGVAAGIFIYAMKKENRS